MINQKNDYILVLGSKPNSKIPKIQVDSIFAANGAAEIAKNYLNLFPKTIFTSVIGAREFEMNQEVQKRVLLSNPDILISRLGYLDHRKYEFELKTKFIFLSNFEQFKMQSQFFSLNMIDVLYCESFYERGFVKRIIHLYKSMKNNRLTGVSTGFFSILYALNKNPSKKIIISGIGMKGGGHYYNKISDRYTKRSFVDRKLILNLKSEYRKRLYTTDEELSRNANLKFWEGKDFI